MARHAISIRSADGRVTRWAPDAADPEKRPHGLKWSSVLPGGHRQLSCDLFRDRAEGFDLRRFDDVRAYGPGNRTRWHGRQAEFPAQSDELKVSPLAEGYAAELEDNQSFRRLYIDRDMQRWTAESLERRLALLAANIDPANEPTISPVADGTHRLQLGLTGDWSRASNSEAQYDAGPGLLIGELFASYEAGSPIDPASAFWTGFVGIRSTESSGGVGTSADLIAGTGAGEVTVTATGDGRYAFVQIRHSSSGGAAGRLYPFWARLVVYGKSIPALALGPGGFYGIVASDLLADVLRIGAPSLKFTTGDTGTIQRSTYPIPHVVFRDPGTPGAAIQSINRYDLRPWFVWDDRTFYSHDLEQRGTVWRARIGQGARLKLEGETSEEVWTGVVVRYRDAVGRDQFVGPVGSGFAESSYLTVTDPANDAVAHGISRVAVIDLPVITDQTGAIRIGNFWLSESNAKRQRGEIVLTGKCRDDRGVLRDVAELRAGDRVEVPDRDDVTRIVISAEYDDDSQTASAALDSTPHTLDALYERLGVSLVGMIE